MTPSPFHVVSAIGDPQAHLAVTSPALVHTGPSSPPMATLCGRPAADALPTPVADIDCQRCLLRAPRFMHLPSYEVRP